MCKTVIHFGGGALGRGLVIPILVESGYKVVLADTNEELLNKVKEKMSYVLDVSDSQNRRYREIPIENLISCIAEENKLIALLRKVDIVTTSVRRENLIHVARILVKSWKDQDTSNKKVICCENIENVSSYFKKLLLEQELNIEEKQRISQICIPDTIVDRICSSTSDIGTVISEEFYECSADANTLPQTGIKFIGSVFDIDTHFIRKRFLMNSYADAISFFAVSKGLRYLYEAASDNEINNIVKPFIDLLKNVLNKVYKINEIELDKWSECYRQRLSNPNIPRELSTVARNIMSKLSLEERFVFPIIQAINNGIEVKEGLVFLKKLILVSNQYNNDSYNVEDILNALKKIWCVNEKGISLYNEIKKLIEEEI